MITPVDLTGGFIGLCFLVFVAFWIATAFSTKRTVRRTGSWRLLFLVILVGYFVVRLGFRHAGWMNGFVWPRTLATGLAADAIALAGLAVMLWARVVLGRNWSADVAVKDGHELVTGGPYHWVRHPIYSGLLLLALGWAVWRGQWSGFWGLAVLVVLLLVKARSEEQLMIQHFGEAYLGYKARVKALVPYVV
jgi:protein-S-isoprenylcysteine O-methyltransferase Ste14